MKLETIEEKYAYSFPLLYKKMWEEGMLNWMRGFEEPLEKGKSWAADVYPEIKEHPPALLHSGGLDFELLTPAQLLDFKYPELWNVEKHHFIPIGKMAEGNVYAFYQNVKIEGENPVVLIWDDMDETEFYARNFEDFIFRKMLEATYDIDKEELEADYGKENPMEAYRADILRDLESISPYLKKEYVEILEALYNGDISESLISYTIRGPRGIGEIMEEKLGFEFMGKVFSHEI